MSVRYTRVGWQDAPSTDTPIDAANLNHMDNGILALSEEVDTELPLLQEQINDISTDIDTQIDEKVPPEVSSWLTEHVDPVGSAVVVDDSLTIQGAAADAKKTGDEISDLKDGLESVTSGYQYSINDIVQGTYDSQGNVVANANIIRIKGFVELLPGDTITFKPGTNVYRMLYGTFNENKVFQSDSKWYTTEHTILTSKHIYVVCVFKNESGTAITPSNFDATVIKNAKIKNDVDNIDKLVEVSIYPTSEQIINNRFVQADGILSPETSLFKATDYLNISDVVSDSVTVSSTIYGNAGLAFYDASKTLISSITGSNASDYGISSNTNIQTFTIPKPSNAVYMRLSAYSASYTKPSDFHIGGYGFGNLNSRVSEIETKINSIETETLYDKKVLVLGDSISTDAYGNYPKWVTDLINEGFFNSANVTNISQHATGYVARYNSGNNRFIDRLSTVTDKETYDLVVIYGGTNDYIQNIPMGATGGDSDTEFIPAVRYLFDYAIQNFTQARICVISPTRTYATWVNQQDKYETDYFAEIRNIAKEFCYPMLNLTEYSGFAPFISTFRNRWTYVASGYDYGDGVHPNEEYERKYLAPMIKGFLKNLL